MDSEERFTDEEVREIFARATDLGDPVERVGGEPAGMSLVELQSIAVETGIDPDQVATAAREVAIRRQSGASRTNRPALLSHWRLVEATVDEKRWERVVRMLRDTFEKNGIVTRFGGVREWTSGNSEHQEGPPILVRLETTEGGTLVTMEQDTKMIRNVPLVLGSAFGGMGVAMSVVMMLAAADPKALLLPVLFGGLGVASFVGGRVFGRFWTKKQDKQFATTLDHIHALLLEPGDPEP